MEKRQKYRHISSSSKFSNHGAEEIYVGILAIIFVVEIEARTLGPILYHYTTWLKELFVNTCYPNT